MNTQHVSLLVMLDLSAAFDTVNHKILLERLQHDIGISGVPLACNGLIHTCLIEMKGLQFRECYLGFFISIVAFPKVPAWVQCSTSSMHQSCVTKGKIKENKIKIKLFNIFERHLPDAHCYADDSQLYLSFRPADGLSSQTYAIQAMERCIEDIRHWMVSDRLLLNDEKAEFL